MNNVTDTAVYDRTIANFVHRGLSPEQTAARRVGWGHYLARREVAAAGGDPGENTWVKNPPST